MAKPKVATAAVVPLRPQYASKRAEERAQEEWLRQRHVEDLRDDTIALVLEGIPGSDRHAIERRFGEIERNNGACVATLWKWYDKKVSAPQMPTIRATLRACGHDLGIVLPKGR